MFLNIYSSAWIKLFTYQNIFDVLFPFFISFFWWTFAFVNKSNVYACQCMCIEKKLIPFWGEVILNTRNIKKEDIANVSSLILRWLRLLIQGFVIIDFICLRTVKHGYLFSVVRLCSYHIGLTNKTSSQLCWVIASSQTEFAISACLQQYLATNSFMCIERRIF